VAAMEAEKYAAMEYLKNNVKPNYGLGANS
jgi:hypothetical protein